MHSKIPFELVVNISVNIMLRATTSRALMSGLIASPAIAEALPALSVALARCAGSDTSSSFMKKLSAGSSVSRALFAQG